MPGVVAKRRISGLKSATAGRLLDRVKCRNLLRIVTGRAPCAPRRSEIAVTLLGRDWRTVACRVPRVPVGKVPRASGMQKFDMRAKHAGVMLYALWGV